jgi:hypothetical protein
LIDLTAIAGARGFGGHIGALSVPASRSAEDTEYLLKDMIARVQRIVTHAKDTGLDFLLFENLAVTREYGHSIGEAASLERDLSDSAQECRLQFSMSNCIPVCRMMSNTTLRIANDMTRRVR